MIIQDSVTSLVIAGAWNPAILNPEWLLKEAFNEPAGQEVPVTMEFAVGALIIPRFTLKGLTFTAMPDRLNIAPGSVDPTQLTRCEQIARNIFERLPHTPISAFGQNFQFVEPNPDQGQLEPFTQSAEFAASLGVAHNVTSQSLAATLVIGGTELRLTRSFRDGKVIFDFNFHYGVGSAIQARERLENTFNQNLEMAKQVVTSLMGSVAVTGEVAEHV